MYDGHGSTRQLAEYDVAVTIADSFSYDGYGVLLQDKDNFPPNGTQTPGKVSQQAANLLYAGEHFDSDSQQYYNRARWYNHNNGTFNRIDPYAGNTSDPQSLHKYLYVHNNPINAIDPSGNAISLGGGFIMNLTVQTAIRGAIAAITFGVIAGAFAKARGATWTQSIWAGVRAAAMTGLAFVSPLFAWGLMAISPILIGLGIASGDITKENVPEIAAYIVASLALLILFKTPQYKAWEVKTAIKFKLPQAMKNLQNGHSVNPTRDAKWKNAYETGNKAAQGSLIHAELADLMRAENMTNLKIEVSYNAKGEIVPYGTKGSVRLDYGVYNGNQLLKSFDLKPNDVIEGSWLQKASKYTNLSPEDYQAISYGGK